MNGNRAFRMWLELHQTDRLEGEPRRLFIDEFLARNNGQEKLCHYCCEVNQRDYEEVMKEEKYKMPVECPYTDFDLMLSLDIF